MITLHTYLPPGPPISSSLLVRRGEFLLERLDRPSAQVSVVLLDDQMMSTYNLQYRGRKRPTNVLSFPAQDGMEAAHRNLAGSDLGDILISLETAQREARDRSITLHQRLTELMIHGLLHLLGYDHERSEEEARQMARLEEELFQELRHIPRSQTMPQLAVNVDHVATMRQARGIDEPDPVLAAGICELAGAKGIVVHLREDRRHIQDRDVRILRQTIKTKLNLEMATVKEIVNFALEIRPDMVTLVPEKRQELTTEGGLDVQANAKKIRKTIARMDKASIPVSLFIDPERDQIEAARKCGATFVELHTGRYCEAANDREREREFRLIEQAAEIAFEAGLRVNAGHGLDYRTTARIAALPTIEELSIGHAIITRSIYVGLDQAVREMLACIRQAV